jgi:hypothetical protein
MATYTPGNITYRDTLEIMSSSTDGKLPSMIYVNSTLQLKATDGYTDLVWSSENSDVAVVDDGLVTAVKAGRVKITVTSGEYSDSIILQVVGEAAEEQAQEEETGKTVIIINGGKTKTEYNGQEHKNEFTAVTDKGENVTDSVHLTETGIAHQATATNCGTVKDAYDPSDFVYDGDANAEFVVSNGWLQIKPLPIKIKANDITVNEGEEPQYSAYVSEGLLEGDTIDLSAVTFETSGSAIIPVVNQGEVIGNYRIAKALAGTLTVISLREETLYNLAEINGTWYRLAKGTFKTALDDVSKYFGKTIDKAYYPEDNYNFDDLDITVNGKTYVYKCAKNAEAIVNGADYYTASVKNFEAIKNKIGGLDGNKNPRWLIPEDQRYNDKNETNSFHLNYTIKLFDKNDKLETQDLYNMLSVDGNMDYYRLKRTSIAAKPFSTYKSIQTVNAGEYIIADYDFTNVVVVIDGESYKYSDHELTGEYESYFTVKFDKVMTQERINGNDTWYNDDLGWLDGSKEQYGTLPNQTLGFHANYNATTHKGTKRTKSIALHSDWPEDKLGYVGLKITLTAELTGFDGLIEGKDYKLKWQYTTDKQNWIDVGAEGDTYTFTLDETTTRYTWKVVAVDLE